jgi:hypothetical protein
MLARRVVVDAGDVLPNEDTYTTGMLAHWVDSKNICRAFI